MSDIERPVPDALLSPVHSAAAGLRRGSLKVFFGYAAGIGKTYSMLEAAKKEVAAGRDVVIGYVEPHARPDTQAMTAGFESLPVKEIEYRGVTLREFDVDAGLARRPDILLVDELAHTNATGSKYEKRWQDVDELRNAGINVWTTLNVQHIETLNDVIGQITGVIVRETIPDRVFDSADELELVDLTPEELLERLRDGKVYLPQQAQHALQKFFQKGNLTALRELSFRQAARRVHTDVETARRERSARQPWATADRLLVCVGPSPTTARVIRTARRMATALDAPWVAASVDLDGQPPSSPVQQQVAEHFRLAERLGAETVTLAGTSMAATLLDYARTRNVTKILIGKTHQPRWRRFLFGSLVDEVLEQSGSIDVYVIHGEQEEKASPPAFVPGRTIRSMGYLWSTIAVLAATLIAFGLRSFQFAESEANTVMVFLAGVAWAAFRHGRGPAILASLLAVLIFDVCFVPPYYTIAVSDSEYVITFAVMLVIGVLVATLAARLRSQIESSRLREQRTSALYELGRRLSSVSGNAFLVATAGTRLTELVGGEVAIYLQAGDRGPELEFGANSTIARHPVSLPAARWVIDHDQVAGATTNTLPNAVALFMPVVGSQKTLGALAFRVPEIGRLLAPDQRQMLEACASQLALALERDQLAVEAAEARIEAEKESVRSSLLSSVSHDLKTPLAAIAGASGSLLESEGLDEPTRRELAETVAEEASRLNRLLENLLQMSKLEAGAAAPNRQWHVLEEIVGSALHRIRRELADHEIRVDLPGNLPLVFVDGLLLEQVFVNLLENAVRYTPGQTLITIVAAVDENLLRIVVADTGPGIPAGAEERIFDKFYRAAGRADGGRGSGLGLAICRAIIQAHGGRIRAANRATGGAEFTIQLPLPEDRPQVNITG
ncbi:Sensor protein KdpD [Caulifigura coniformis]|uniref:histidine kinase n=1 Tax=Caulifigura coniformis TaxID=2527983 RepID=A0A517SLW5_9PLAN|nr:sensor histidine kinase KdpD [Caulifigura coniformis]QDT57127.1 Sensor protein KdpD [Caulifigura coniformis]